MDRARERRDGYAVAAILEEQVVALRFVREMLPFDDIPGDEGAQALLMAISDQRLGRHVRELQSFGRTVMGYVNGGWFLPIG